MNKKVSWGFIIIGVLLLVVGTVYPSLKFVVVVSDDTPPVIGTLFPQAGQFYTTMASLSCGVYDKESGIQSVNCTVDGTVYTLAYAQIMGSWEIWQYPLSTTSSPNTEGSHSFTFTATNNVGLTATSSGTYQITTMPLEGNWYVNDVLVTSPSQILYFQTLMLTFTFVKTAGPADSQVSCNVKEGDRQLLILTYQGDSTWAGTYTFTGGTHTVKLGASDGTRSIIMSLLNLSFNGVPSLSSQQIIYGVGITFVAFGGYGQLTAHYKKRKQTR